ncbi:hypothetical protein QOT17_007272 [Balamuthia mandrillaris]
MNATDESNAKKTRVGARAQPLPRPPSYRLPPVLDHISEADLPVKCVLLREVLQQHLFSSWVVDEYNNEHWRQKLQYGFETSLIEGQPPLLEVGSKEGLDSDLFWRIAQFVYDNWSLNYGNTTEERRRGFGAVPHIKQDAMGRAFYDAIEQFGFEASARFWVSYTALVDALVEYPRTYDVVGMGGDGLNDTCDLMPLLGREVVQSVLFGEEDGKDVEATSEELKLAAQPGFWNERYFRSRMHEALNLVLWAALEHYLQLRNEKSGNVDGEGPSIGPVYPLLDCCSGIFFDQLRQEGKEKQTNGEQEEAGGEETEPKRPLSAMLPEPLVERIKAGRRCESCGAFHARDSPFVLVFNKPSSSTSPATTASSSNLILADQYDCKEEYCFSYCPCWFLIALQNKNTD